MTDILAIARGTKSDSESVFYLLCISLVCPPSTKPRTRWALSTFQSSGRLFSVRARGGSTCLLALEGLPRELLVQVQPALGLEQNYPLLF